MPLDNTWVYANEMWRGASYRAFNHTRWPLGKRRGIGDWVQSSGQWFHQSCLHNEPPVTQDTKLGALSGWWRCQCARRTVRPDSRSACTRHFSRPRPVYLLFWLFLCVLCNKTVAVSIGLSWVLWVILVNYQIWRKVAGTSEFIARSDRMAGSLRTPLAASIWCQGKLGGSCPITGGIWP